ncbi:MAG: hypothetical protein VX871_02245 [Pseudomonadota bacterium]|nr:hypothetical protein [Pseudomonadota bacterium]
MRAIALATLAGLVLPALPGVALAAEPTAIVEEAAAPSTGLQPMDFLDEGKVIELKPGEKLTLGYLSSCVRETIAGGKITIGADKSKVENGTRKAEEVDCAGARVVRVTTKTTDVAGAVFRKGKWEEPLPKPNWTSYSTKPLFRLTPQASALKLERIDKTAPVIEVPVTGGMADFAKAGVKLEPSGLYEVTAGNVSLILQVSPLAEQNAPLLSRIVPM